MLANGLTAEEISTALHNLLNAPNLQVSDRNKRFLRYVVEETLADRGERIKSYSIAVDVFGRGADFDGSVDSIVRTEATRLRGALSKYYAGDGAADPIRIFLPPGSYVPQFERTTPPTSAERVPRAASASTAPDAPAPSALTDRRAGLGRAALVALALVALLGGAFLLHAWFARPAISASPLIVLTTTQSIGADPKIRAMALGLTQSLVTALTRYEGLRIAQVTEHDSVGTILAQRRESGGAAYLLESSIDADDKVMRTRWRLISEPDRTVIWSDQVDENLNAAEALNVEDRIAEGVARLVASSDGIVAQAELHKPALRSTLGYQCILKAQAYVQSLSVTLHAEARDCLEATVAQNPEDAEAWALLSYIYVDESRNGFNPRGDTKDIWARAMAASNRALELAPWSSLVQQMRSTVLYQTGDYIGFEQAGRKAIELNPGNPFRYFFLGNRLFALGHYEEGNAMVRKGLALDPLPSATHHGTTLLESYRLGRYKDAADEAATLDLDPNYYLIDVIIAAIDGQLGDRTAAAPHVAKVLKLRPDYAKTFRLDWRTRHFREDFIEKVAEGLRKAGLNVE